MHKYTSSKITALSVIVAALGISSISMASQTSMPVEFGLANAGQLPVKDAPTLEDNPTFDTWNIADGQYGGDNIGPAPEVIEDAEPEMPEEPEGLPDAGDVVIYDGNSTTVISSSFRCEYLTVQNDHTLQISGDVVIFAEEQLMIKNYVNIELLEGASLLIYCGRDATIDNNVDINMDSWDPNRVMFVNLSCKDFRIQNNAQVCASVVSSNGLMIIENNADLYGWYGGNTLLLKNQAGLHIPEGTPQRHAALPPASNDLFD